MQIGNLLRPAFGAPSGAAGGPGPSADPLLRDPMRTTAALARRFAGRPGELPAAARGLERRCCGGDSQPAQQLAQLLFHLVQALRQGQLGAFEAGLGPKGGCRCLTGAGGPAGPFGASGPVDYANARPFGAADQRGLMAAARNPQAGLTTAFGQGQEGNCSAIAVIKASMDKLGAGALAGVRPEGDGVRVAMRDGAQVSLTGAELSQARFAANLRGPDSPAKRYATLMYAAMAKRAQMEGHEGARTFPQALAALANGDNPYDSARFAGLSNHIRPVDPMTLGGQDGVVAWNNVHAMYVDKNAFGGHTADRYGTPYAFHGTDTRGGRLTHAFAIVG